MDKLVLATGMNMGEFEGTTVTGQIDETDSIYAVSATLGSIGAPGLYASANYNKNEYHDLDAGGHLMPSAYGIEAFVSYNIGNGLRPYAYYNMLKADENYQAGGDTVTKSLIQYAAAGLSTGCEHPDVC